MSTLNKQRMKLTTFEVIGIALSVACMATALWLVNVSTHQQLTTERVDTNAAAVIVGSEDDALAAALTEANATNGQVDRLVIDDVVIGAGPAVKTGDTVTVHYRGALTNGVLFDSSYERGTPFSFTVGQGRVITGWEEGLIGMQAGGQRTLVIPPALGYGDAGGGPIPPNSTLLFTVELIEIQ